MPAETPLIPVDEHLKRILDSIDTLPAYDQPLLEVMGLPIAEDIMAPLPLPAFDNSGMDGYAVVHHDVAGASEQRPVHLPVVGEIAAGAATIMAMSPGTAVRIMTGAPIPQGCDAVVPVEWTDGGTSAVVIEQAPDGRPAHPARGRGRQGRRPAGQRGRPDRSPSDRPARLGRHLAGGVAPAAAGRRDLDR